MVKNGTELQRDDFKRRKSTFIDFPPSQVTFFSPRQPLASAAYSFLSLQYGDILLIRFVLHSQLPAISLLNHL